MGASKAYRIGIWGVIGLFFMAASALALDNVSDPILPEGLMIEETYSPGFGSPVGSVQRLEEKGVVLHAQMPDGYLLAKDLPVFQKDTVFTLSKTRLQLKLIDNSVIVLGPSTELVIDESVFTLDPKNRSTFLGMALGKGRFVVEKFVDAKRSDFVVKTQTAVVGVRGSDFVVRAAADVTQATAFEDTVLAVFSLAAPDAEPVLVRAFERVYVKKGALPLAVEKVSPDEIEQMKREFPLYGPSKFEPLVGRILVPEKELVLPERPETPEVLRTPDIVDQDALSSQVDFLENERTSAAETRFEDEMRSEGGQVKPIDDDVIPPNRDFPGAVLQ